MAKPKQLFGVVDIDEPHRVLLRVEAVSPAQAIVYARFVLGKRQRHQPGKLPHKAIAAQLEAQEVAAQHRSSVHAMRFVALTAQEEQEFLALAPAALREKLLALEQAQRPVPGGRRARAQREREQLRNAAQEIDAIAKRANEISAAFEAEDDGSACCIDIATRRRNFLERGMSRNRAWRIAVDEEKRKKRAEARRRKRADHREQLGFGFAFVPEKGSQ